MLFSIFLVFGFWTQCSQCIPWAWACVWVLSFSFVWLTSWIQNFRVQLIGKQAGFWLFVNNNSCPNLFLVTKYWDYRNPASLLTICIILTHKHKLNLKTQAQNEAYRSHVFSQFNQTVSVCKKTPSYLTVLSKIIKIQIVFKIVDHPFCRQDQKTKGSGDIESPREISRLF